jgi:hypothetical protein
VGDGLAQDLVDVVVVALLDRGDALIGMPAETGEDLPSLLGVDE